MAYKCPRCGGDAQRGYSGSAQMTAGLVGALFYAAFGSFECKKCGKIPRGEFPAEDRAKMTRGTIFLCLGGVVLAVVVIALIASMN